MHSVGLGEWHASRDSDEELVAFGLGSCVGLVLFDGRGHAGLCHVVLPDSAGRHPDDPGKYADTAAPLLLAEMAAVGADGQRLKAILCGGAQMFAMAQLPDIGANNVAALHHHLRALGIPVCAEDVGGSQGRTLRVDVGSGRTTVARAGGPPVELAAGARTEVWGR